MIQGIGSAAVPAQAAIEAALKAHEAASKRIEAELAAAAGPPGRGPAATGSIGSGFAGALENGLRAADAEVRAVDALPAEMLSGRVADFHEIAARIKQSELTFKFALEVRNKLIDAYRETMRMSV